MLADVAIVQGSMIRRALGLQKAAEITPALYRRAHGLRTRAAGRQVHEGAGGPVRLEVNHGRWSALCPECRAGMTTGRFWAEVRCFSCGAVFEASWPADLHVLEAHLERRPAINRNWRPGETAALIVAENLAHGIGRVR